jgi:hypothetical protein
MVKRKSKNDKAISYHHDGADKKRKRNVLGGDLTVGMLPYVDGMVFIYGASFIGTGQVHLTQTEAKWLLKNLPKVIK